MSRPAFETASRVEGSGAQCQDRVAVFTSDRRVVAVVADGAGGTAGGAEAAEAVVEQVRRAAESGRPLEEADLCQLLLELSDKLELAAAGQTTAVLVVCHEDRLVGASVGDSGAWWVGPRVWRDLTDGQPRKPLLGGGVVAPLTFTCDVAEGALLLATDGVLKYAPQQALLEAIRGRSGTGEERCAAIIDGARLPSGELQDDAAVVLVELERKHLSSKHWTRFVLAIVALVLLAPPAGCVAFVGYWVTRPVPTEASLRTYFQDHRDGLNCLREVLVERGTSRPQDELLADAHQCRLPEVVMVYRSVGSPGCRIVLWSKHRFIGLDDHFNIGFAFGEGISGDHDWLVSGLNLPRAGRFSTNFVPLEDGWFLFEG